MTFSKKAQTAGYFFGDQMLVPDRAYRQFSTWIGDPARAILSKAVVQEILKNNLVDQCVREGLIDVAGVFCLLITKQARVGSSLFSELEKLAGKHPEYIQNLRGKGRG